MISWSLGVKEIPCMDIELYTHSPMQINGELICVYHHTHGLFGDSFQLFEPHLVSYRESNFIAVESPLGSNSSLFNANL